jgi:tight adherence protein C
LRLEKAVAGNALFRGWERELRAIGGINLFGLRIENVGELATVALGAGALFFLVLVVGAVAGGISPLAAALLLGGLGSLFYTSWRRPIEEYKDSFLRDGELPAALEMFIGGLEAGMSVESTLWHISRHLKGVVGRLFGEAQNDIDYGMSVNDALAKAAEKSLSIYFQRFMSLVQAGREMGGGDTQHYLKRLLEEINDVKGNERIESAGRINNILFFPIFLGYFLPTLILFSLPFIFSLRGMFQIF